MTDDARLGVTSRITRASGRRHAWQIDDTRTFILPVIVDFQHVDPRTRELLYRFEATIDLVAGTPALTSMNLAAAGGLEPVRLQREFRWASPLDIVTRTVPTLLEQGIDPFTVDLPTEGFPEAADLSGPVNARLTDAVLEDIASEYLTRGRGYAVELAAERQVSPRTVVSWVEKARRRGILTRVPAGGIGGSIVPKSHRITR